jgi:hypothetical protein
MPQCAIIRSSVAGWSSSVARWAHNPKVVGSNPAPATNQFADTPIKPIHIRLYGLFLCLSGTPLYLLLLLSKSNIRYNAAHLYAANIAMLSVDGECLRGVYANSIS